MISNHDAKRMFLISKILKRIIGGTMDQFVTLKENIIRLEQEQGVKVEVDKDHLEDIGVEDLARIALAYGVKMKDLF